MEDTGFEENQDEKKLRLLSRDELEERVKTRTSYLENLMDTMVDILLKLGPDGRIKMANEALYNILGYEEGEVVDKPIDFIFASPDKNEELSDMMTKGELIDMMLSDGYVKDVEIYFSTKDNEVIPMSLSASIMEGENGDIEGIVCVAKDISERKEAEEKAEFLHSLLRHDLGNKLQVTMGSLQMLQDSDLSGTDKRFVENSLNSVEEAVELIKTVRMLNKLEGGEELNEVDVGKVVEESAERHEDLRSDKEVEIKNNVEKGIKVKAGSLLKELFSNLIENSLVHSGCDEIQISVEEDSEEVKIRVEDDGEGIPDEEKEKILQKGYKGKGSSGSGLGMHLVKRIAETYEGEFTVRDSDLGGACFEITLHK